MVCFFYLLLNIAALLPEKMRANHLLKRLRAC